MAEIAILVGSSSVVFGGVAYLIAKTRKLTKSITNCQCMCFKCSQIPSVTPRNEVKNETTVDEELDAYNNELRKMEKINMKPIAYFGTSRNENKRTRK